MVIDFVFDGLQIGGIERVGIEYIKLLKQKNHAINVINLNPVLNEFENEIPVDVPIIHINFPYRIVPQRYSNLKRKYGVVGKFMFPFFFLFFSLVSKTRCFFCRKKVPIPDVAIAFAGHYNDLTFVTELFGKSVKKISWIHGNQYSRDEISPGFYCLYKKVKNLVCLSNFEDEKVIIFNEENGINKIRLYNPINLGDRKINYEKVSVLRTKYMDYMIMVGRLAKDKDQATLIKSLKILRDEYHFDKVLVLVGDGPERKRLESLVDELNLSEKVVFTGSVIDVQNYYLSSWLYVHSSPAEGLPTVILEAMYYGLPVVTTDSQPGVREILNDNEFGLISPVGDAKALAENIFRMYNEKGLRERFIEKEKERIKDFMPQNIVNIFEEYMANLK